jgi:4-amino-4-deoxy-L-arabinose transferase-like glycosyltransferase
VKRAVFGFALAVRLAVVAWAHARFPAVEDGRYYDTLARRIAEGQGYTWLWPDGAVTYVAHYPVGYPGLLGAAYAVLGASPMTAMAVNAFIGAASAVAVHQLVLRAANARRAALAAAVYALHPALLFYVPAVMTEGVAASLVVVAAALAVEARDREVRGAWALRAAAAAVLGAATLVRPQCLAFAPFFGALSVAAATPARVRLAAAAAITAACVLACTPWMARNCVRMHRCSLVSMNAGWNLLIGDESTTGGWAAVLVPDECREVWDEAQKDVCFERAARARIQGHPGAWLARAPAKVAMTLDYFGAAPWYLHASNPAAFDEHHKLVLGAAETVVARALLVMALVAAALIGGPARRVRFAIGALGVVFAFLVHGWVAYVALTAAVLALGPRALARAPAVFPLAAAAVVLTAGIHAVFFGAGRYGLAVVPFVTACAFAWPPREKPLQSRGFEPSRVS